MRVAPSAGLKQNFLKKVLITAQKKKRRRCGIGGKAILKRARIADVVVYKQYMSFRSDSPKKLLKSVLSAKNSQRLQMKIVNFEIFKCKGSLLSFKRKNKDNPFCEYYGLDFDGLVLRELPEITSDNIKDIAYDLYIVILDEHKIMIKLRDALWDAIEVYDNANILSVDSIRTGLKPLLDIATHVVKEYESEQE